ncbi:hypothetical protein ABT095_21555 [Kitasatospora sp. NPDC002227]|uniref:hypothetical protein n=1 Tax=Kitasatospora sp. NPDC002227 TaxID=3154773 RepID=UPI00331EEC0F
MPIRHTRTLAIATGLAAAALAVAGFGTAVTVQASAPHAGAVARVLVDGQSEHLAPQGRPVSPAWGEDWPDGVAALNTGGDVATSFQARLSNVQAHLSSD